MISGPEGVSNAPLNVTLAMVVGFVGLAVSAGAAPIFSASAGTNCGIGADSNGGDGFATASANCNRSESIVSAKGRASANVAPKRVAMKAFGEISHAPPPGSPANTGVVSSAFGSFQDTFVLTAVDPFGAPLVGAPFGGGTFTALIGASGVVSVSAQRDATAAAILNWSVGVGAGFFGGDYVVSSGGASIGVPPAPGLVVVPWIAGQTIPVVMSASATISAAAEDGTAFANANFGSTLEWLGIQDVRDQEGNPIEHFTAVGSTGIDWVSPADTPTLVPEPASLLLLAIGLLGLGFARRSPRP